MSGSQAPVLSRSLLSHHSDSSEMSPGHQRAPAQQLFLNHSSATYSSKFTHWPPLQHMDRVLQKCDQKLSKQFCVKGNWRICQFSFGKCFLWLFIVAEPAWSDQRGIKINSGTFLHCINLKIIHWSH